MGTRSATDQPTLTALGGETLQVPALEVLTIDAKGKERRTPLGLAPVVVGTDPAADLPIVDPRVSRRHCSVALTERGVVLRDLGSKNGTFFSGIQVVELVLPPNVEI